MVFIRFICLCIFLLTIQKSHGLNKISEIKASIVIPQPIEIVFPILANATFDHLWRDEVNFVKIEGPFRVGAKLLENARLGFHSQYLTPTEITSIITPYQAIYKTPKGHPFFLTSSRYFKELKSDKTLFSYKVQFSENMIKDIWGIKIPPAIAVSVYRRTMRGYLSNILKLDIFQ